MFWKNKKKILVVLLALALMVSQLSGIDFKKVKAAETGYTELSLMDFGYTADQAYTGTNHCSTTPTGVTEMNGIAITNYITFSTASDGCCIRIGADGGWTGPISLFISGTTLWSWDNSGGGKHTQLGTVAAGTPFKLRMEFDTVDSSGTSVTQVKFYLNDAATPKTVVYTQLFAVYALVYGNSSTVTISEIAAEEDTTATYTEYTFSDFGHTEGVVGGADTTSSTTASKYNDTIKANASLDKVAFTGYVKFDSDAEGAASAIRFGSMVAVMLEKDSNYLRLRNPSSSNDPYADPIDCGQSVKGEFFKLRLEFDTAENATDYIVKLYVEDDLKATVTLTGGVASFAAYTPLMIIAAAGETVEYQSYSDEQTFTEVTFSDFGLTDGDYTASQNGSSATVTSATGLDGVAFSGYVTFPASGTADWTNEIRIGNALKITPLESDQSYLRFLTGYNSGLGTSSTLGSSVMGRTIKLRVEFALSGTADYQAVVYVDDTQVADITCTDGVAKWAEWAVVTVGVKSGETVTIGSYKKGETYKELTFRDLGIDDQTVAGGESAATYIQGTTTLGSAANCMNDVAFTGYVKFPDGASAMANKIQFGNLVYVTTENSTSLRLRLKGQTNEAYGDIIDCGKTITNTFIKLRLEFNIIDDEYVVKVHVDDTLVATQTLEGSKAAFTWFPLLVYAEAAKNVEIKSYPEIVKTFTELTFSDFSIADQTVFGSTTETNTAVSGKNATIESTKDLTDHAFTGYVKFMAGCANGGSSIQLGNLIKIITVSDTAVQLKNPADNSSYTDAIDCGTTVKGTYVKFRMEFEVANTTDYLVTLYANDEQVGQTTIAGGVAQFTYTTMLVNVYTYEKVSVKSYPENPATYTEVTFSDFQLADQTLVGSSTAAATISNYNDAIKTSASLSGVAFTGYVKFQDGATAISNKVQFGSLMYVTPVSSTALQIKCSTDNTISYSEAIECGKTITGRYIKLRLEFTVANTTDYIVKMYVDDVEMDAWIITDGVTAFQTYTALVVQAGANEQVAIKSYPSYTSADARTFEDLTTSDFNIADGTYTNADDVSGEFNTTVTGTGHNTLNGKNISANVTFSQAASAIYIGGTDKTTGLMIGTDATQEGKLLIKEASGLGGLTEFYADATTAGATLVGSEVKLTVSFEKVDSDGDANTDDVKVGIYFNNTLYNGEYIYLTDYTLGTYMGVVATDGSIKISAIDRAADKDAYEYRSLTNVMESYNGGYYVLGNGMLNVYGEINGVFDLDVENVIYGATYQTLSNNGWYLRYAGLSSAPWETLDITADQTAGTLTFGHATNVFTNEWTVGTGLDFTKEVMVEISADYVDADWDGSNNDVKIGIWVNGELVNNQYFYLIDYVNRMGTGVIYAGADANTLQMFETGDNPVMDMEYDTEITADGYVIPDCDSATIDGEDVAAGTKLTTTGEHEVSYVDHGMTYHNTVTITKLGDANMDSVLGAKDIIHMQNNLGQTDASELKMKCADVNNNDNLGTDDIAIIKDLILGNTTAKTVKETYKDTMVIGAISDTHLRANGINDYQRQNNYREALEYFKNRGASVIIMNGDISDLGEDTSYTKLVQIFEEVYADVAAADRPEVITTADNHEYFDAWWWNRTDWGSTASERQNSTYAATALQETKDRFRNGLSSMDTYLAGTSGYYMHTVRAVNGYYFIGMSEDVLLGGAAGFTDQSITWLDEQLAAATAADSTKPVFVAIHQPPQNTVLASEKYGNGITAFQSVLAKYPQAIVFGGHTHAPVKDHRSIYQNQYTVLNTGTTYYTSRTEYTADGGATQISWANAQVDEEQVSEGLLLEVTGSKVKVEAWDFWNAELIREYNIDASQGTAGFQYTDAQLTASTPTPVFSSDATMEIQQVSGTEVKLLFPSATNEGSFVHHYTVTVKSGSTVVSTLYYDSYFRKGLGNMATEQELTVTGLTSGTKYTFEVTAGNSFWEESAALTATMS